MAFITKDLINTGSYNGYNHWRYDTADAHATVDSAGYFDNNDDDQIFQVGDMLWIIVWDTVRSGTPSTYGHHLVTEVASGVVDITNVTVGVMTDSD